MRETILLPAGVLIPDEVVVTLLEKVGDLLGMDTKWQNKGWVCEHAPAVDRDHTRAWFTPNVIERVGLRAHLAFIVRPQGVGSWKVLVSVDVTTSPPQPLVVEVVAPEVELLQNPRTGEHFPLRLICQAGRRPKDPAGYYLLLPVPEKRDEALFFALRDAKQEKSQGRLRRSSDHWGSSQDQGPTNPQEFGTQQVLSEAVPVRSPLPSLLERMREIIASIFSLRTEEPRGEESAP